MGGIQTIFKNVSERLVAQFGDEVTVFTTNAVDSVHGAKIDYLSVGEECINGVIVRRFPFSRQWISILKRVISLNRYLPVPGMPYFQLWRTGPISSSMRRSMQKAQADVILAAPFNYLHMYYPHGGHIPLVYMGALHLTEDEYIHPMIIRAINRASAYIAFTSYERDVLIRRGVQPEKLHVIGPGIDWSLFQQANDCLMRQELKFSNDPVVAYLGRLASYKGIDTLILAMRKVWLTMPHIRLLISGAQTDFVPKLQKMIEDLPTEWRRQVVFPPHSFAADEAPHLFAASDIFVTVSSAESFGIVYLEAWACRKPVIGGRIKAVASVIEDGQDGLLVECGNVDELANALLQLLQNPELCASMGQRGYEKVAQEHTWDIVTQKIRQVYEAVA
jgi:glycosyltransferase involved in cell wall biosynthesis